MRTKAPLFVGVALVLGAGLALGAGIAGADSPALRPLEGARADGGERAAAAPPAVTPTDLELALHRYDAEEKELSAQLSALDEELGIVSGRVLSRGRAYYKQVHAGLLPAGGGFDALVDHAARVERNRMALVRDLDREKALRKKRQEVSDRLSRIKAERAPLEVHREAIHKARSMMRAADDRRAAFERAFESSTAPPDYVAIYGADLGPSDASQQGGFASMMGRLPFPVAGRAEVRKLEAAGAQGPAVELRSPAGASARAVAAGRVVFADRYENELVTVIVDHGERYFTVYGNLDSTEVRTGDTLAANAALGPIALRRHEGAVLYFELRQQGRAVDPAPWLGL